MTVATFTAQVRRFATFGLPKTGEVIRHARYTIGYDRNRMCPLWVQEKLTPDLLKGKASKRGSIKADPKFAKDLQPSGVDFRVQNISRGHLAALGNYRDKKLRSEVNVYTNMVPQNRQMNGGIWNRLENKIRKLVLQSKSVHVVSGPLFIGKCKKIGPHEVTVPSHLYKVVLQTNKEGLQSLSSYIIPNEEVCTSTSLDFFKRRVEEVEQMSGLAFFSEEVSEKEESSRVA